MTVTATTSQKTSRRNVLEFTHEEARDFFLKSESYFSLELPSYINFDALIADVHKVLVGKNLNDMKGENPLRSLDNVNYKILNNKDGTYAWRPFQLIHPALYVSLVHQITTEKNWETIRNRFRKLQRFSQHKNIHCLSIPVSSLSEETDKAEQVTHWWGKIEQRSIELSLEYACVYETDITDCYGSIYTHSIPWALHGRKFAKKKKKDQLIGNVIDWLLQDMSYGQTNGIPQGSTLMDFIAEMVLGYADLALAQKIFSDKSISNYQILRYRDDYRVFVNNPQDGERILKNLSEVTSELGLKLNSSKTKISDIVVRAAIKQDKLAWTTRVQKNDLQEHLLNIHDHAMNFPNAGSLLKALQEFHEKLEEPVQQPIPLIAIVVDIAYRNPRTYPQCAAILSKLLTLLPSDAEKPDLINKIKKKFSQIPNTGHLEIWLQRVTIKFDQTILDQTNSYKEKICKLVNQEQINLWNSGWISSDELLKAIDTKKIIDRAKLEKLDRVISPGEINLFRY